jgi:hypothetical protein
MELNYLSVLVIPKPFQSPVCEQTKESYAGNVEVQITLSM